MPAGRGEDLAVEVGGAVERVTVLTDTLRDHG
jgi:hypothetical protein